MCSCTDEFATGATGRALTGLGAYNLTLPLLPFPLAFAPLATLARDIFTGGCVVVMAAFTVGVIYEEFTALARMREIEEVCWSSNGEFC